MIGIDTYSWYKLIHLYQDGWQNLITRILSTGNLFITHEVKKELVFRFSENSHLFDMVTLLPAIQFDYRLYEKLGFDQADASLLEYSKREGHIIITEDQLMIAEATSLKENIIQLVNYFGRLFRSGSISSKELYHIVRRLREMRNITEKKEKYMLNLRSA